jgi:hypothetical protein
VPYGAQTQQPPADMPMPSRKTVQPSPIRHAVDAEVIPQKPQPVPQGSGEGSMHGDAEGGILSGGMLGGCMDHLMGNHEHPIEEGAESSGGSSCQFAWMGAEWLHWRLNGPHQPPLLNLIAQSPCSCGNVDAVTVDGGGTRNMGWLDGVRVSAGVWLCNCWGIETDYMVLASRTVTHSVCSNGGFLLGIPFIDQTGAENNAIIMCPQEKGTFESNSTISMWGLETNLIHSGCDCSCWGCNWILGFRYLQLAEGLSIDNSSFVWNTGCTFPVGTTIALSDQFATRNNFFGPQIGTRCDWCVNKCISFNASAKVAMGVDDEYVRINGYTMVNCGTCGQTTLQTGGFFAQRTNIGSYNRGDFCVVPEARLGLDFALTCKIHANIGYSFLYMSDVARPGDQIDRNVNISQINGGTLVGAAVPAFCWHSSSLFAQGLDLGLEFRF